MNNQYHSINEYKKLIFLNKLNIALIWCLISILFITKAHLCFCTYKNYNIKNLFITHTDCNWIKQYEKKSELNIYKYIIVNIFI